MLKNLADVRVNLSTGITQESLGEWLVSVWQMIYIRPWQSVALFGRPWPLVLNRAYIYLYTRHPLLYSSQNARRTSVACLSFCHQPAVPIHSPLPPSLVDHSLSGRLLIEINYMFLTSARVSTYSPSKTSMVTRIFYLVIV